MSAASHIDELTIINYRKIYSELSVPLQNRRSVIRALENLIEEYRPILSDLEKDYRISLVKLGQIRTRSRAFVKSNFSPAFLTRYETTPPPPATPAPMALPSTVATLLIYGLAAYAEGSRNHTKEKVREFRHRYDLLVEAKNCLNDFGLHSLLSKRQKAVSCRYNVLIESKQRNSDDEYELLIDKKALEECYINPYLNRQPIQINGKNILFKSIDRITISSSVLFDPEIILFRDKHGIRNDIDFIKKCTIETNELLRRPAAAINQVNEKNTPTKTAIKKRRTREMIFCDQVIAGIQEIQARERTLAFIDGLHNGKTGCEAEFRDFMRSWLKSYFTNALTEEIKGKGRIDLTISHPKIGKAIVEFKGWWNRDKNNIIQQVYKYITDFEKNAYLFIINHTAKHIDSDYRSIVTADANGYVPGSWKTLQYSFTDFDYYVSKHKIGSKTRTLYHFIFNLHP